MIMLRANHDLRLQEAKGAGGGVGGVGSPVKMLTSWTQNNLRLGMSLASYRARGQDVMGLDVVCSYQLKLQFNGAMKLL